MGEAKREALARQNQAIALDTFGGRIHVEWDPVAAVTPLGQLPFLIDFLKVSGLFDTWVADCPLVYQSNTGSHRRAVLATFLLSNWRDTIATRISLRFAMTAFTPICWALRNSCRKMRQRAHWRKWTKLEALPGWSGIWQRPHNLYSARRGYSISMPRSNACTAHRKAPWWATTRKNRGVPRTATTAHSWPTRDWRWRWKSWPATRLRPRTACRESGHGRIRCRRRSALRCCAATLPMAANQSCGKPKRATKRTSPNCG